MNSKVYRWCSVPQCNNSSIKTPEKLFIYVPMKKTIRNTWLKLARREPKTLASRSVIYFCEDHFDLPNDMKNYMKYHVMGSVQQVHMKAGCVPSRFECQPDRQKRTSNSIEIPQCQKKQSKILCLNGESKHINYLHTVEEHQDGLITLPKLTDKSVQESSPPIQSLEVKSSDCSELCEETKKEEALNIVKHSVSGFIPASDLHTIEEHQAGLITIPKLADKYVQESSPPVQYLQGKSTSDCSVLCEETMKEEALNIVKHSVSGFIPASDLHTIEEHQAGLITIPKLADKSVQESSPPIQYLQGKSSSDCSVLCEETMKEEALNIVKYSVSGFIPASDLHTIEEHQAGPITIPKLADKSVQESSPPIQYLQGKSTSDCSVLCEETKKEEASNIVKYSIIKIMRNPLLYIGVPENCYDLLYLIEKHTKIPINHVLLCLQKIRLNSPFTVLADDFCITSGYARKIFFRYVSRLSSALRPFIISLDCTNTKRNLPIAFRHKFHQTGCILDCLEIEIQKPEKSVTQALSWSDYKKAYTIKYLVSCTPNGLVNYISPGYGGRVTDTCLIESCDFTKSLQPGMCVMADGGFKHVEQFLLKEKVQLVRPPIVVSGATLANRQAASLRIHSERVIRCLREFDMLKPHACLDSDYVKVLDEIIVIACALINLQDSE